MRVTWVIMGSGAGEATVDDLEGAVGALQEAVRGVAGRLDPEVAARLLHGHWGPLRMAMRTDGWSAVNAGEAWSLSTGAISVEVSPERE
jgi:hypothetical protein